jgi:hypothetical protein
MFAYEISEHVLHAAITGDMEMNGSLFVTMGSSRRPNITM